MPAIIVHGGAWAIPDDEVEAHKAGVLAALQVGWEVLSGGGSALDAVEAAIRVLEDDPTFDAGIGSFLNAAGHVELDAALMDGATMRCGAVAAVRRVRHPISVARNVLDSHHILLVGEGADAFAVASGAETCDPSIFVVDRERARWEELRSQEGYTGRAAFGHDTVGCVALDASGRLAAGTSTGGTPNKVPGRVGDSPLIGCGLYADGELGGCSTTGWGESIIKVVLAKTAVDNLVGDRDPNDAAARAIDTLARRADGLGGCIVLDAAGRVGWAHNTPRMACAFRTEAMDQPAVHIARDEAPVA